MRWSPAAVVVALLSAFAAAQDDGLARRVTSLDGTWRARAVTAGAEPGGWREIAVPAAFETAFGTDFDGIVEYVTRFRVPDRTAGERVHVRFAAVMTAARVSFNGVEVGTHLGGWTPFRCELPAGAFRDGQQELTVVVDERVGHNTQGFLPAIQPHFGGIWQSVELVRYRAPGFDPDLVELFPILEHGRAQIRVRTDALPAGTVSLDLWDGPELAQSWTWDAAGRGDVPHVEREVELDGAVRPWSPDDAATYRAELTYRAVDGGPVTDRISRVIAFREVEARGRSILLNGSPLHVRGVLHWGHTPPTLDPNPPESFWREELRWAKASGFNLIKACLWVPPPSFFDVALEEGLLVWQEYPAWHPDFSPRHRDELLREYGEFFALDRARAPIVVRSLTCETGRGAADEGVVEALYRECKRVTGAALVEDDSSWIGWNRFHDFYDDHPYGNAAPWLGRLEGFDRHIEEHGPKPFLLGEAMAADTWVPAEALRDPVEAWWKPRARPSMVAFEARVTEELGAETTRRLVTDSLEYALRARKYQFESFRRTLPRAGYVASVMRDFPQARMGFFDATGRPKWTPEELAWHGEHMLVLDDARAIRSISLDALQTFRPAVRLTGDVRGLGKRAYWIETEMEVFVDGTWLHAFGQKSGGGETFEAETASLSEPIHYQGWDGSTPGWRGLTRCRVRASFDGVAANEWTFYAPPDAPTDDSSDAVRIESEVTPELLDWVAGGGRLLLLAGGHGGPRSQGLWFLQGAPFAPVEHPFFERVPRDALFHLQPLDLDGPLFPRTALTAAFDVVLGFWDTHDENEEMKELAFLLEVRLGKGRILATSLGLDATPEVAFDHTGALAPNPARAWVRRELSRHLAHGPAPRSELAPGLVAAWKRSITGSRKELDGTWLLRPDPDDVGERERWAAPDHDDSDWIASRAGAHWEAAGLPHHDGVAWYRKAFETPADWTEGEPLFAVFDGVDDSYDLYVNGAHVAAFGDPETGETVWLVRTHADVGPHVEPGRNLLALRVVDHQGAGGLHRRVWLGTAEPTADDLVNR